MTTRTKTDIIHVRVKPGLKAKAERLAALENRSLTNWLETLIERLATESGLDDGDQDQDEIPAVLISQGRHSIKPE